MTDAKAAADPKCPPTTNTKGAATPTNPAAGKDAAKPVDSTVAACPLDCPRCHAEITTEQMKQMFSSASDADIEAAKGAFNESFDKFSINRCVRKAHFFAQVLTEVGEGMKSPAESLNYTSEKLKTGKPFSYFKKHPDEADLYGRNDDHKASQEDIGNRVYAGRNGNDADPAVGDGWRYRGKGFIQLTGKSNYADVQKEIDAKDPGSGIDIVKNEGDILTPRGGMLSAMGFWSLHGLNGKADRGATGAVVDSITRVINQATDSYSKRRSNFEKTKKVFRVPECVNLKQAKPKGKGKGKGKGKK